VPISTRTLSVLVEDKPGVLARVAALFSRRGFNIQSLAVGATEQKNLSRMTIVVAVEDLPLEQVSKQLHKLINVIKIVEQDNENSVSRELALIKVRADASTRGEVIEAFVVLRAAAATATDDLERALQNHVRTHYAAHAYPRRVHVVASLPKTPSGKIKRSELRRQLREAAAQAAQ